MRLLLEEGDVACDVLKVPYHGREVEVSEEFLSACAPKIAWIPDSQEEPAGEAVVQYLKEQLGASVYRSAGGACGAAPFKMIPAYSTPFCRMTQPKGLRSLVQTVT